MDPNSPIEGFPQPVVTAQVVDERPPRRRRGPGALGILLILFLLLVLGGSILLNLGLLAGVASLDLGRRIHEQYVSHQRDSQQKIVIITLDGIIVHGEGFVKRQIDRAIEDDDVKGVVLRVNSPGGTISGSDYLYHHLCELREKKPIVASMGSIAASGGYYVSMAVGATPDTLYAEPTTWTGSIGVIIPHYNASALAEKWGIEEDSVASHRLKNMGSLLKSMTEEERQIFQGLVDEGFDRFKEIVCKGRPAFAQDPKLLDKLATGQVYTAEQAKENGLIDQIGFVESAVDQAIKLAGLEPSDVCVVKYKPEPTLADILFPSNVRGGGFDLEGILEMTTPRAYYLCTQMPPLIHSGD